MAFELGLSITAVAGWFALFAGYLLATRPRQVPPAAATQDFGGDEPPAVVSLLAHGWEVTGAAARSTVLDLAARRLFELRQPGNDPRQTTIHLRRDAGLTPSGLTRYERRVFDRVSALASGGVLPLTAITFRDEGQAKTWTRKLRAEVIADARQRGLSRRRFDRDVLTVLTVAAALVALAVAVAAAHYSHRAHGVSHQVSSPSGSHSHSGPGWLSAAVVTFALLAAVTHSQRGERDTPAGRAVAARWLGLREFLHGDEAFRELPPAAVAVWDRYLAYGCALGETHGCDEAIDLGLGDRTRVWSSFGGGWHRVRVHYPRFWGRYGKKPLPVAAWAMVCLLAGLAVLRYSGAAQTRLGGTGDGLVTEIGLLVGLHLVVRGAYRLVRVSADVTAPVTLTGEVLWDQSWRSANEHTVLYYLAVDDGHRDRSGRPSTTAWGVPRELRRSYQVGDVVRLRAHRWTRRVLEITVVEPGRARHLLDLERAESTEGLIAEVMGLPPPDRRLAGGPARLPAAGGLLTVDEVSRAVGQQVTARPGAGMARPAPLSLQLYEVNGRLAVHVAVTTGLTARLALRSRHAGTPLTGIGDEAYLGDHWAIARSGETAVTVQIDPGMGPPPPGGLPWLLWTAVARLPAEQPRPSRPSPSGR